MDKYFKIVERNYVFSYLKWDTKYFDIPCYKILLSDVIKKSELDRIYNQLPENSFLSIINENNNKENNINITSYFKDQVFFADFNIRFVQKTDRYTESFDVDYCIADAIVYDKNIDNIATNSFKYSRFYNDTYLDYEKRMNIYSHWVNSAFLEKGRYFLKILDKNSNTIAFILFNKNIEDNSSTIELIAIDKSAQNKGLGTIMINILKKCLNDKGISTLYVGTQSENIEAMNFYSKNGFKICSCNSIYHMWKTNG